MFRTRKFQSFFKKRDVFMLYEKQRLENVKFYYFYQRTMNTPRMYLPRVRKA